MNIQQKVAIITGASRGIGKEIAWSLTKEGVRLVLVARSVTELQEVALTIKQAGGTAIGIQADVSDEKAVDMVINHTLRQYGQVDFLINNAGIGVFKPAENVQVSEWERMMDVNAKGSFLMCKAALKDMKKRGAGHIVIIASHASRQTFEMGSVYCASKYAQNAFASALRKEVRKYNVKVSSIYPGVVDTYFNNSQWVDSSKKDWLKPKDVADTVTYVLKAPAHVAIDELVINPISQVY